MGRVSVEQKRVVVSGTVPAPIKDALEDYRWANRFSLSSVLEEALTDWVKRNIPNLLQPYSVEDAQDEAR